MASLTTFAMPARSTGWCCEIEAFMNITVTNSEIPRNTCAFCSKTHLHPQISSPSAARPGLSLAQGLALRQAWIPPHRPEPGHMAPPLNTSLKLWKKTGIFRYPSCPPSQETHFVWLSFMVSSASSSGTSSSSLVSWAC